MDDVFIRCRWNRDGLERPPPRALRKAVEEIVCANGQSMLRDSLNVKRQLMAGELVQTPCATFWKA